MGAICFTVFFICVFFMHLIRLFRFKDSITTRTESYFLNTCLIRGYLQACECIIQDAFIFCDIHLYTSMFLYNSKIRNCNTCLCFSNFARPVLTKQISNFCLVCCTWGSSTERVDLHYNRYLFFLIVIYFTVKNWQKPIKRCKNKKCLEHS